MKIWIKTIIATIGSYLWEWATGLNITAMEKESRGLHMLNGQRADLIEELTTLSMQRKDRVLTQLLNRHHKACLELLDSLQK